MNPIRRLLVVLGFLSSTLFLTGQKQGNIWMYGENNLLPSYTPINFGLDFNHFPAKRLSLYSSYNSWWRRGDLTSIANKNGELHCFGTGSWLRNSQLQPLNNGDSILLYGSNHRGLLLPRPKTNHYILLQAQTFYHSWDIGYGGYYSSINTDLNNGLGRVVQRSIVLEDSLLSLFDATYSTGGDSIWVAWAKGGTNQINFYTVTNTGVQFSHSQQSPVHFRIRSLMDNTNSDIGYFRFSPNGNRLVISIYEDSNCYILNFDNASGTISNAITIIDNTSPYFFGRPGFSPNSRYLYAPGGSLANRNLYQIDLYQQLDSANLLSDIGIPMFNISSGFMPGMPYLVPDGSILFASNTSYNNDIKLDRIRFPDLPYPSCQIEPFISLDSGKLFRTLPNIFTGLFNHPKAMATTNCLGDSTLFRVAFVDSDSLFFDFGDGNTALSTHSEYRYLYSDTGTFSASVRYKNTFGNWENLDVSVRIGAPPGTLVNKSLLACAQDTLFLQLPYSPNSQYLWSTGDTTAHLAYSGNGILNYTIDNQLCSVSDSLIIYRVDCEVNLPILCEEDSFSVNLNQSSFDSVMLVIPGNTPTPLYFPNAIASQNIDSLGIVFFKANHSILIWYPTHFREKPPIELPPFSLGCIGESIILNPVHPDVYNYLWPDGTQYSDYMDSFSGNHILIYGDHDCEWTDSFSFVFFPCNFELGKLCQNIPVFFQLDEITPDAVFWKFGDGDSTIELGNTVTHTYTKEGNYTLQCSIILNNVIKSFSQNITIHPGPMGFGMDTIPLCFNDTLFVQDDTAELDFLWFNQQTTPYFVPQESGEVSVRLDINGCEKNDTTLVVLHECNCLDFIPNAFSPTKDQLNEYFSLTGNCIFSEFSIRLYSRWGELVFESKDPHFQFDGTFKGIPLPQEAYVYVITAKQLLSGETIHKKGILHLLK